MLFAGLRFFSPLRDFFFIHASLYTDLGEVVKDIVAGSDLIRLPEHCHAREDNAVMKEDASKRGLN